MKGYPPRAPRLSPTFFLCVLCKQAQLHISASFKCLAASCQPCWKKNYAVNVPLPANAVPMPHILPTRHRPLMTERSSSDHSFLRGRGKLCPSELRRWPTSTRTVRHDQPRRPENIGCRGNSVSICEHSIGTIKKQKKLLGPDSPVISGFRDKSSR